MSIAQKFNIDSTLECCYHCKFMGWHVGVGQGIRCHNENNEYRLWGKPEGTYKNLKLPTIPGLAKKCELFEWKIKCE
jgi:hypothetical protein